MYLRDRESSPRLGRASGDGGTLGCRGSQVGSESQFHVSRGTSTSPRKMLRPRLSRCHTDRLNTRPWSSACGTEYRRVSLKIGFRFRFFTVVLRLLCLSGRR